MKIKEKKEILIRLEDLFTALSKAPDVIGSIKHFPKETQKLYIDTMKLVIERVGPIEPVNNLPKTIPNVMKHLDWAVTIFYVLSPVFLALILYWMQVEKEYIIIAGLYYPAFIILYFKYRAAMVHKQNRFFGDLYRLIEHIKKVNIGNG